MIKDLMYIELKTGYSDDGPAWIGYVKTSKTKKTIYFNDHAFQKYNGGYSVSAKYCYAAHESRLHQNDRCKRFTLCLVLTVRFRSLAPWGKLFQLFI